MDELRVIVSAFICTFLPKSRDKISCNHNSQSFQCERDWEKNPVLASGNFSQFRFPVVSVNRPSERKASGGGRKFAAVLSGNRRP